MCQALTCGQVLAWAWVQVLQSSGSLMIMLRFTTLSAWDRHWLSSRKKKLQRAHCDSNIKSACVSALMGSVPRKMAEVLQRVSALIRNRNHVAWLFRLTSNTKPLVHIKLLSIIWKKLCMSPSILPYQDQTQIQEFLNTLLWLGSGQRYQILYVFARCASQITQCHFLVWFLHGSVLFDSLNMQKCVTQIIYLGPLPTFDWYILLHLT